MNILVNIGHGSGAELMTTSLARELLEKYDNVYLAAANKYFTDVLALEDDRIHSIDKATLPAMFSTIMRDRDSWNVASNEVYQTYKFFSRQDNYYDALREIWGLKRKRDWSKDGSEYTPYFNVIPEDIKRGAFEFAKQHPKVILFQRQGGINPVTPPQQRREIISRGETGLIRSYPLKESERLVSLLQQRGYEVLQYCLPEEMHVKGCLYMQQEMNQLFYYELSKYVEGVITIDSSLLHLTIHNAKKVVCLWAQSASGDNDCRGFGYKKAINLFAKVDTSVPYFNGIAASPYIEQIKPEDIVEAFIGERSTEKESKVSPDK